MEAKVLIDCGWKKLCAIHRTGGRETNALVIMAHGGPGGDKRGPLGLFDVLAERLVIVPGGGHSLGRPAERAIVLEATLDWLKKHLL